MRYANILLTVLLTVLVFACAQEQPQAEEEAPAADSEKAALEKADPAGSYGIALTLDETLAIGTILADPASYEGQAVRIEGTVAEVCPMRGCWIEVESAEGEKIRVKVKDGEIVFPLSAKGHAAVVEGFVEKVELTQKQAIGWLSHEAEERGVPFDSTTVTGPMTIWRIKGAGAEIKG